MDTYSTTREGNETRIGDGCGILAQSHPRKEQSFMGKMT